MKRAVFVALVSALTACDWNAAEQKARCARDPSCVDVGSPDAGSEDAGMTDAGPRVRSVSYPRTSTFYLPEPVGLYAARDGGFWVVGNVDDTAIVELRNSEGELVHDLRFTGVVINAYANAAVDSALAVLRDAAGQPELVIFDENGTTRGVDARYGRIVSIYRDSVGSKTSVWDVSEGLLGQHIYDSRDVSYAGLAGQTPCNIDLADLEVLPPSSGGSVAIIYFANACDAGVVTEGIVPNRKGGVQLITPAGVRSGSNVIEAQAVGGSLDGQLRFITRRDGANITIHEGFFDGGLQLRQSRMVASTSSISAGDVHDEYVTFAARGSLQTDTVLSAGPLTPPEDAVVAHISPWAALELGKTDSARMPVLHLGNDDVWVLWAQRDGGMQLTNFTWSLDGGFVVR